MGGADDDEGNGGPFSELVALLRRHEGEERRAADVEADMQRLLLLARDAPLREQLVQAQGVRRVTLISKAASTTAIHRYCAGYARSSVAGSLSPFANLQRYGSILGCLAHSERGRLSASSCSKYVPYFTFLPSVYVMTNGILAGNARRTATTARCSCC